MAQKRNSAEQIVARCVRRGNCRARGRRSRGRARSRGVSDQTFSRWRIKYGAPPGRARRSEAALVPASGLLARDADPTRPSSPTGREAQHQPAFSFESTRARHARLPSHERTHTRRGTVGGHDRLARSVAARTFLGHDEHDVRRASPGCAPSDAHAIWAVRPICRAPERPSVTL